jgi:hypothetical protein
MSHSQFLLQFFNLHSKKYVLFGLLLTIATVDIFAQQFPMEDFVGVNLRRQDPTQDLGFAGFIREYHDWVIDEGNVSADPIPTAASPAYPNNEFRWNPGYQGQSSTNFDTYYPALHQGMAPNEPVDRFRICADMKYCLPRLSGNRDGGSFSAMFQDLIPVPLSISPNPPFNITTVNGISTTSPSSYTEYSDWVHHFTMAYGETTLPQSSLKIPNSGPIESATVNQQMVGYIEIWNEQDKFWWGLPNACGADCFDGNTGDMTHIDPMEYAAMASAAYDGCDNGQQILGEPGDYNLGVNHVDPNMKFVFGGLSEIDDVSWNYVDHVQTASATIRANCSPQFPFDALNFHHYSDNYWEGVDYANGQGVAPELDTDGSGTTFKKRLREIRTLAGSNIELWLSEFGYDTNLASPHRVTPTPANANSGQPEANLQEVQGRWLVRSFLEIAAAQWDRAMLYDLRDADSNPPNEPSSSFFKSSGILTDNASGYQRKTAYWYIYTMKEALKGLKFSQELNAYSDNGDSFDENLMYDFNLPRKYIFRENITGIYDAPTVSVQDGDVIAVWYPTITNEANSSYKLRLPNLPSNITDATFIEMVSNDENGEHSALTIQHPVGESPFVEIRISEKPVFIHIGIAQDDPELACIGEDELVEAVAVSCDAVFMGWNVPTSYPNPIDHYQVYYFDANDSDGDGIAPEFDLSNPKWKLYTNNLDGSRNSIVVAGLTRLLDNYQFVILATDTEGNVSEPCVFHIATSYCSGMIDPIDILPENNGNPDQQTIEELFDYSNVDICRPLITPYTGGWEYFGVQDDEIEILLPDTDDFEIHAITLFDGLGSGDIIIKLDDDLDNSSFIFTTTYSASATNEWRTIPITSAFPASGIRRIVMSKGADPKIEKILLYGHKSGGNFSDYQYCCGQGQPQYTVIGEDENSVTLTSDLSNDYGVNINQPQFLVVNGTLEVDGPYTLTASHLYMKSGAKILVPYSKGIHIRASTIEGCEKLWKGIELEEAGSSFINMEFSTIRDAESAISITRVPNPIINILSTLLIVRDSRFEQNQFGLRIYSGAVPALEDVNSQSYFQNCVFDGTNSDLKPPYSGINYYSPRPSTGVILNDIRRIQFYNCEFTNLSGGIHSSRTGTLNVFQSKFYNIPRNEDVSSGIGIFAEKGHLNCIGFGNVIEGSTETFKDMQTCIALEDVSYQIRDNRMFNVEKGIQSCISVDDTQTNYINRITNNFMNVRDIAIQLFDSEESDVLIAENHIQNDINKTIFGVLGFNFVAGEDATLDIRDNHEIRIRSGDEDDTGDYGFGAGVYLRGTGVANVENNKITVNSYIGQGESPLVSGILNENCVGNTICSNEITAEDKYKGRGIRSESSPNCSYTCNEITNLRYGIEYLLDCTTADGISGNTIDNTFRGLFLRSLTTNDHAMVGTQQTTGNTWSGVNVGAGDASATFENFAINQQALIENLFSVNQIPPNVNPVSGWFSLDFSPPFTCSEMTECSDNQLAAPNIKENDYYWKIATEEINDNALDPVYRWLIKRNIYTAIKEKYEVSEIPPALSSFVNEEANTTVGAFYEIDKQIQQLSKLEPILRANINGLTDNIHTAYEANMSSQVDFMQMENNDQLTYLQSSETAAFNADITDWSEQKAGLQAQLKAATLQAIDDILDQNNAVEINTENKYEKAEQRINEIYLSLLASDGFDLSKQEKKEITIIADMCPLEGGSAVYKARTLYSLFGGRPKVEWLESCRKYSSERSEINTPDTQKIEVSSIYPNPNNGVFEVFFPDFDKGKTTWNLSDTFGKVLQSGQFTQSKEEIITKNVSAGVYLLKIRDENGIIAIHKVLIL